MRCILQTTVVLPPHLSGPGTRGCLRLTVVICQVFLHTLNVFGQIFSVMGSVRVSVLVDVTSSSFFFGKLKWTERDFHRVEPY